MHILILKSVPYNRFWYDYDLRVFVTYAYIHNIMFCNRYFILIDFMIYLADFIKNMFFFKYFYIS